MIKTVRRKDIDALVLGPNGVPSQIGGTDFYAPKSGQPDQWLDAVWLDPRVGNVEVGPVEGVGAARKSRRRRSGPGAPCLGGMGEGRRATCCLRATSDMRCDPRPWLNPADKPCSSFDPKLTR